MRKSNKGIFYLVGFIIFAVFFELVLRLAGVVYKTYRIGGKRVEAGRNAGMDRILCLGDSFTFGIGAARGYSYPEQLQEMLDKRLPGRFIVYNAGIPGQNSSEVLKNIDSDIKKYNPQVIILMIGRNNKNILSEGSYVFFDNSLRSYLYRADLLLSRLRIYEFFKTFIKLFCARMKQKVKIRDKNYFAKSGFSRSVSGRTKDIPEGLKKEIDICLFPEKNSFVQGQFKTAVSNYKSAKEEADRHIDMGKKYLDNNKINAAIAEFKRAAESAPYYEKPYCILGFVYFSRCVNSEEEAVEALKKAVEINPFSEEAHWNLFSVYYRTGEDKLAFNELEIINFLNPNNRLSRRLLTRDLSRYADETIFERMLEFDIKSIITLTSEKRIRLILQSYPSDWPNEILAKLAQSRKLDYVDNQAVFEEKRLLEAHDKGKYFAEDQDHCSSDGYRLIAENVFKVLIPGSVK